jgi:carbonic anhydrase/acetyltransferase-like protein (isoleucine patch superfamily)
MSGSFALLYQCSDVEPPRRKEENVGISYVEFEDEAGVLRRYRKHVNGRGLVATTAKVDPTAFVDPTAYVDPGAEVQRGAQIGPGGWVEGDAIVAERAIVGVNAHVGRRAVVGRNAVIGPYATIGSDAKVQNGARVPRELTLADGEEYRASSDDLRRLGLAA